MPPVLLPRNGEATRAVPLALLGLALIAPACRHALAPPRAARHLVLVTIDTLRADRLGAYGSTTVATPHLDRIGREGAMAIEATAHVPLTRPSHVSLFTGLLPPETGVRDNISPAVVPETPLLAEVLKKAGFTTAAFVSSVVLESSCGLGRGFDTYADRFEGRAGEAQFLGSVQKKGDATTGEALRWLEGLGERLRAPETRVFLWLHLYDPHDPYEPPEPYAARYAGRPYDGEVAFSDALVGRLDEGLGRLGLRDETLLLVTSDHGEGLGEHREALHGFFTYQTTLRIPFLVRGPGIPAGTRIGTTVRLVDVFPTVLDLLGVPAPAQAPLSGLSLAGALRGGATPSEPVTYAESLVPLLHFGWSDLRVVREGRWKYIQAPRPELYDLATDPGEQTNLASAQASRAEAMRGALARFLDLERKSAAKASGAAPVSTELLEKLGALGYVGGSAPAETRTPGADPKDRVEEFRFANDGVREGLLRFHAKDYAGSVARFEGVLRRGISSFEIHFYLARGLYALRRHERAARHFEEAAVRAPAHAEAWEGLADCRAALGDSEGALKALRRGQEALPTDAALRTAEARLLRRRGRLGEARAAYEAALPLAPKSARLRMQLGELLRDMGEVGEAIRRQREAVELEPQNASFWNSLGMTLGGNRRLAEAERCFREALRLDEKDHRHAFNLGLSLARQGRGEEARPFLELALRINPAFAPARDELRSLPRSARK
jgi:arylsulfatase A-like enzyme/Flp pilus assembly protein TadD